MEKLTQEELLNLINTASKLLKQDRYPETILYKAGVSAEPGYWWNDAK